MTKRPAATEPVEAGQTCPRCGDLCPWGSIVCAECGARLHELGSVVHRAAVEAGDKP